MPSQRVTLFACSGVVAATLVAMAPAARVDAQIRVNPTGVSTNANGATTVFLTFGGVGTRVAREGVWCGELMDAAPDLGRRCDPSTIFGTLPARYDLHQRSGTSGGAVTDIMSIPPSVTRRAYEDALRGARANFFYVRRFEDLAGGPDEYVAVTCRLTGGGVKVPFALTDVQLAFDRDVPVLALAPESRVPPIVARIAYNGTGRLKGSWEVVLPGEEPPGADDLLTEATLPAERRGTQRRYTQLERFNVFLPPNGRVELPGPPVDRVPTHVSGTYLVLLRIEADDEREGDSDLGAAGAGSGVVHSGGVAGFPLTPLRYVVGSGEGTTTRIGATRTEVTLLRPRDVSPTAPDSSLVVSWAEDATAVRYRIELANGAHGEAVFTAYTRRGVGRYAVPPFVWARVTENALWWRVVALDAAGRSGRRSPWWHVRRVGG